MINPHSKSVRVLTITHNRVRNKPLPIEQLNSIDGVFVEQVANESLIEEKYHINIDMKLSKSESFAHICFTIGKMIGSLSKT